MPNALGIDFGGTKILAGVVDTDSGEVRSQAKKRTHSDRGHQDTLDRLLKVITEALEDRHRVSVVGIGIAGLVDTTRNALVTAPNLPQELLGDVIPRTVQRELGVPVSLFNDVASAAAGEATFGAGRGHPDFVCVFVGTGIGGAIYRDGKPYRGATGTAGEIGHTIVDYDGRLCACGGRGHLEAYASRTAMVAAMVAAMHQGRESSLRKLLPDPMPADLRHVPIRSRALAEAVANGDALAIEILDDGARYLAAGLVSVVNFYNPPRMVLGGGVVDVVDRFFDRAAAQVCNDALAVPSRGIDIVKAALGDFSGIVGAAALASRLAPAAVS